LCIARRMNDEDIVLYAHLERPEERSLADIDAEIDSNKNKEVNELSTYRNAMRLARVPWPFRRSLWWIALNVWGGERVHHFGTFGTTSVAAQGASLVQLVPLLTSTFYYGLFDEAGEVDMRLSFDHRVFDGETGARALAEMERVLLGEIVDELKQLDPAPAIER